MHVKRIARVMERKKLTMHQTKYLRTSFMQKVGNLVDKKMILYRIVKRSANQKPLYCTFWTCTIAGFFFQCSGGEKVSNGATVVDVLIKQLKRQQQLAEMQPKRCWLLFLPCSEWQDGAERDRTCKRDRERRKRCTACTCGLAYRRGLFNRNCSRIITANFKLTQFEFKLRHCVRFHFLVLPLLLCRQMHTICFVIRRTL